jgi:hypothetical protein
MSIITDLKALYQIDDSLWLEQTIKLLKNKEFEQLDLENLLEELEDLGNEKKRRVESFLEQIIRHILLLQYWEAESKNNQYHWRAEIVNFQNQLKRYLTTNLRQHLEEHLPEIYQDARRYCQKKTNNSLDFPIECPYSLNYLLNFD